MPPTVFLRCFYCPLSLPGCSVLFPLEMTTDNISHLHPFSPQVYTPFERKQVLHSHKWVCLAQYKMRLFWLGFVHCSGQSLILISEIICLISRSLEEWRCPHISEFLSTLLDLHWTVSSWLGEIKRIQKLMLLFY